MRHYEYKCSSIIFLILSSSMLILSLIHAEVYTMFPDDRFCRHLYSDEIFLHATAMEYEFFRMVHKPWNYPYLMAPMSFCGWIFVAEEVAAVEVVVEEEEEATSLLETKLWASLLTFRSTFLLLFDAVCRLAENTCS